MSLPHGQKSSASRSGVTDPQSAPTQLSRSTGRPLSHRLTASISPTSPSASEPWPVSNECRHVVHTVMYRDICKWSGYINDVALSKKITDYEGEAFRRARSTGEYLHLAREVIRLVGTHVNHRNEMARVLQTFPHDSSPDPARQQYRVFRCFAWVTTSIIDQVGVILMSTLRSRGDRTAREGITRAPFSGLQNRAAGSVPPGQVARTSLYPNQTGSPEEIPSHRQNPGRSTRAYPQVRPEVQVGPATQPDTTAVRGRETSTRSGAKTANARQVTANKARRNNEGAKKASAKNAGPKKAIGKQTGPKRKAKKAAPKKTTPRKTSTARKKAPAAGHQAPTRSAAPSSRALPGPSSRPPPWFAQWIAPGHPSFVPQFPPGTPVPQGTQIPPQLHQGPISPAHVMNHNVTGEWVRLPQQAIPGTQMPHMPLNGQAPRMPPHKNMLRGHHILQAPYPLQYITGPAGGNQEHRQPSHAEMTAAAAGPISAQLEGQRNARGNACPQKVLPPLVLSSSARPNILGARQVAQAKTRAPAEQKRTSAASAGRSHAHTKARVARAGIPVSDRVAISVGDRLGKGVKQQNRRVSGSGSQLHLQSPVPVQRAEPPSTRTVSNPMHPRLLQLGPPAASGQGQLDNRISACRVSGAGVTRKRPVRVPLSVLEDLQLQPPGTTDGDDLISGGLRKILNAGIVEGLPSASVVRGGSGSASTSTKPALVKNVPEAVPGALSAYGGGENATAQLEQVEGNGKEAVGSEGGLDADEIFAMLEEVGREYREKAAQLGGGAGNEEEAVGAAIDLESFELSSGMPELDLPFEDAVPHVIPLAPSRVQAQHLVHSQILGVPPSGINRATDRDCPTTIPHKLTSRGSSIGKRKALDLDEILDNSLRYIPKGVKTSAEVIRDPRRKKQRLCDAGVVNSVGKEKHPTEDVFGRGAVARWESFSTDIGLLNMFDFDQEHAFRYALGLDPTRTQLAQLMETKTVTGRVDNPTPGVPVERSGVCKCACQVYLSRTTVKYCIFQRESQF